MQFTIITVTYNAQEGISKTLDSIKIQKFQDYELLLIDGRSGDRTLDIASEYLHTINNMRIISENDKGIYDAMNKGVGRANGKYVYFLNAGDRFVSSDILSSVSERIRERERQKPYGRYVFHGNIIRNGAVKKFPDKFCEWKWIYLEHAYFSHQGIFASAELLREYPFDLSLKICADRDWMIHTMRAGAEYVYMEDMIIAEYEEGGASFGYARQQKDSLQIARKYGGAKAYYFVCLKRKIGEMIGHERA